MQASVCVWGVGREAGRWDLGVGLGLGNCLYLHGGRPGCLGAWSHGAGAPAGPGRGGGGAQACAVHQVLPSPPLPHSHPHPLFTRMRADAKPPSNMLFVCKLNPVTTEEDLEIIFGRWGGNGKGKGGGLGWEVARDGAGQVGGGRTRRALGGFDGRRQRVQHKQLGAAVAHAHHSRFHEHAHTLAPAQSPAPTHPSARHHTPLQHRFGSVTSCDIIRDAKTGDSLNYAFIGFDKWVAAAAAG